MHLMVGQLVIILAPFMDYEIYAKVAQVSEDSATIEMKTDSEIPFDREILCMAVEDENIFEFYTQAIAKDNNLVFIKLPERNGYTEIEKRKFSRVDCNIGFVATPVSINNIPIPNSDKRFNGIIRNISGGGVLIETNLNLPVGMVFSFKLKLNFFMDCKAAIVRTLPAENGVYHSGCQFVENNIDNIKTISMYAFREKLKQKRQELNQRKITKGGKE